MSEIRFYHLQNQSIEQALPGLVAKAYEMGHKIWVKAPHGNDKDGNPELQPVWISHNNNNANGANVLIVAGGTEGIDTPEGITLHCEMFQGSNDSELKAARSRWKSYKDTGKELTYWQQNERGGWDKKA